MALLVIIFKIEIKYLDDRTLKAYIGVGTPKLLPTPAPPFNVCLSLMRIRTHVPC